VLETVAAKEENEVRRARPKMAVFIVISGVVFLAGDYLKTKWDV